MASIDSLNIEITASSRKAILELNRLSATIGRVSQYLGTLDKNGASLNNFASGVNTLGSALRSMPSMDSVNQLSTSLRSLARIKATNMSGVTSSLQSLGTALRSMGNVGGQATVIRDLAKAFASFGYASVSKATAQIPALATAMSGLMNTLSRCPQVSDNVIKMTNALANFTKNLNGVKTNTSTTNKNVNSMSRSFGNVYNATSGASRGLKLFNNTCRRTQSVSKGLASAIGKIYATYWLLFRAFSVFRKAIDYASDLTEVQNVVEQTFGQGTSYVDEFARASKDALGMSELTAKEIASTYQAMGSAMDISASKYKKVNDALKETNGTYIEVGDNAQSMSLTLTKLAGDMASFYNKDQKDVAEDLQAVYTGMTKPLRKYGIDLTEATLQEYANAKGMGVKIKQMSQAEKVMLRYQYVIEHTSKAQGDFLRTADTWANQVKVLKQNFVSLGTTIGQVFINAFKPVVSQLNKVLVVINDFAIKVANALGNIFGWVYEGNDVGLIDDLDDSVGDLGDDLDDANNSAKKLKNTIMGYDELNVMQTPKEDTSGGGTGTGTGGGTGGNKDSEMGHWIKKYESDIDNLFDLGRKISDTLTKAMQNIPWNDIYKAVGDGFKGLAQFLNGLITPDFFGEVGKLLARSLNTAFHGLYEFAKEFDWENLGKSIANGINEFFKNANFDSWVETLKAWINGICETLQNLVTDIQWVEIAKKIGEAINNAFDEETFKNIASTIAQLLNSALIFIFNLGETLKWEDIGKACASGINKFFDEFEWETFAETINTWVQGVYTALKTALCGDENGEGGIDWDSIWEGVKKFLGSLDIETIKIIIGAVLFRYGAKALTGGLVKKLLLATLGTAWKLINVGDIWVVFKLKLKTTAKAISLKIWKLIKGAFVFLKNDIKGAFGSSWVEGIDGALTELKGVGSNAVWSVAFSEMLGGLFERSNYQKDIDKAWDSFMKSGNTSDYETSMDNINNKFKNHEYKSVSLFWENLKSSIGLAKDEADTFSKTTEEIPVYIQKADGSWEKLDTTIKNVTTDTDKISGSAQKVSTDFENVSKGVKDNESTFSGFGQRVGEKLNGMFTGAKTSLNDWTSQSKEKLGTQKTEFSTFSENVGTKVSGIFNKGKESISKWTSDNSSKRSTETKGFEDFTKKVGEKLGTTYDKAKASMKTWSDDTKTKRDTMKANFSSWSEDLKKNVGDAFDKMKEKGNSWWDKDAKPLFDKSKWDSELSNVKSAFESKWNEISSNWGSKTSSWFEHDVKPMFSKEKWSFDGIKSGLEQAFDNAVAGMKKIWNEFANWINDKLSFSWDSVEVAGKTIIDSGSIKLGHIPTFATGGFPEDGLFMANHGEMVGQFSNGRTAVANNEQITEGIRQAVVDGMMEVVMATSNNNQGGGTVVLNLDGRKIAESTFNNFKTMSRQGMIPKFI